MCSAMCRPGSPSPRRTGRDHPAPGGLGSTPQPEAPVQPLGLPAPGPAASAAAAAPAPAGKGQRGECMPSCRQEKAKITNTVQGSELQRMGLLSQLCSLLPAPCFQSAGWWVGCPPRVPPTPWGYLLTLHQPQGHLVSTVEHVSAIHLSLESRQGANRILCSKSGGQHLGGLSCPHPKDERFEH